MNKGTLFILALMVCGIGMILRVFFGGGGGGPIGDDPTGIIREITQTGNNQTTSGDNNQTISTNTGIQIPNEMIEIRVMMPRYFYTAGRKNLAQDLYTQNNIYLNFNFIDNLNVYKSFVYNKNFDQADLILIPYDRVEKTPIRTFTFQQNVSSIFDQLISPIIGSENVSFLPFAADPVVMYTLKGYDQPSTFGDFFDFTMNWNPKNPLYFPLFFGLTSEDYDREGFLREYQDIIRYALMHYFSTYRDINTLQKRVDCNVFENYNLNNLNTILKAISSPACEDFPSICFQLYNFAAIRFGFLSDADVVRQYFSNKKSEFASTSKEPILFSTLESPVRVRGRSIPSSLQDTKTINGIYIFLVYYLNNHDKYNLRSSTLSVFKGDTRLFDNVYIGLRGYILTTGGDYIEDSINKKNFWKLIEHQISAKDYLRNI